MKNGLRILTKARGSSRKRMRRTIHWRPSREKRKKDTNCILLLRNNRCDEANPDGIFHAHKEYHNIKSESIGLIEAMGMFILPGRLEYQLKEVEKFLTGENSEIVENMSIHKDMVTSLLEEYGNNLDGGCRA